MGHRLQKMGEDVKQETDGRVILDTEDATADAYLWSSHNCTEAWLQFEGELQEIRP